MLGAVLLAEKAIAAVILAYTHFGPRSVRAVEPCDVERSRLFVLSRLP